jgi:hypothetical protein
MDTNSPILTRETPYQETAASGKTRLWFLHARSELAYAWSHGIVFLPIIACALWALTHAYHGIVGDATIYIGRALADLDPQGLGRDLLFTHDGQSQFSLYPRLVKRLVAAWGTNGASLCLVVSATCLWIAALSVFARRFVSWQHVWIIVAFVAVLPNNYGSPQHFTFSEMMANPRPLAEALVLFGLAALIGGRTFLTFLGLLAATLVHPLMALAGWTAVGLALCLQDRRWWIAAGAGIFALALGTILGVPPLDRLILAIDPDVKALAMGRAALLFPTHWPLAFLGPIIAQMATIAIAASLVRGRQRYLLLAIMVVGIGGITIQILFGDILSSMLVIQAQFWRMAWLTGAIGSFALALCSLKLWEQATIGRVVLAFVAMTWLASDEPFAAASLGSAALILHFTKDRFAWQVSKLSVWAIWTCACLFALVVNVYYFSGYAGFVAQIPADASEAFGYFWNKRYIAFPIGIFILALMLPQAGTRFIWLCRGVTALILVTIAIHFWDDRRPMVRLIDSNIHPPELMNAIANKPGEVLWIGGAAEAWYLTGRPQWASPQQGVASIFSRDLTLEWRERIMFLRNEKLVEQNVLSSAPLPSSAGLPHVSEAGLTHLCGRPDAPAWVIAPSEMGENPLPGRKAQVWHLPQPTFRLTDDGETYAWHKTTAFLIYPCTTQ